jgi:pilus assembly protein FimV
MSRRLTRISLVLALLLSSEVWAIGLGDIHLDSALNEPLRAEIELLSPTPEELANLTVTLASPETFARYGIDRPFYLQELAFNVASGPDGAVVQVRSPAPITEPFLTFLVEATWSAGRLLREYTVLLDPPTYSPPAIQQTPAIEAPRRATTTDSARIERQPPAQEPQPTYTPPTRQVEPPPTRQVEPPPPMDDETPSYEEPAYEEPSYEEPSYEEPAYQEPYSTTSGEDYYVNRGDTLWGITNRLKPDGRLTINQTMIAIFEANPDAFVGNINRLKAGAALRIPSADDVFQIERGTAFSEVRRMNDEWRGETPVDDTAVADTTFDDTSYDEPAYDEPAYDEPTYEETTDYEDTTFDDTADTADTAADETYDSTYEFDTTEAEATEPETETSLTLVPPDEEPTGVEFDDALDATDTSDRETQILEEISALEAADVPEQESLIEIRDNRLAELRQELAEIRGEVSADDAVADAPTTPSTVIQTPRAAKPGIVERFLDILGHWMVKVAAAIVLAAGLLLWFLKRSSDEDDDGSWETLDSDEIAAGAMSSTETLRAPTPEESIVVVEQDSGLPSLDDTIEVPEPDAGVGFETEETVLRPAAATGDTGQFDSLEDTFSSETAVNLDQTDPLAEADFHMAYGLYDQAADLINGALETDPGDQALMSKLCEIYFVWGNRDAFIDAASNIKNAVADGDPSEWDKIVIMGQQIAGDHELFAGAGVAGATKAVDLSFEAEMDDAAELDMDFGVEPTGESEVLDLGAAEPEMDPEASAINFDFGAGDDDTVEAATAEMPAEEPTAEMPAEEPTAEMPAEEETAEMPSEDLAKTAEMPAAVEPTVETPTIEEQFSDLDMSELPSLDESLGDVIADSGQESEATAEINLDELDLAVDGLEETELASLDDLDATGTNEALPDQSEITGKNPEVDPDATGVQEALDAAIADVDFDADADADADADIEDDDETLKVDDLDDAIDVGATGLHLAADETGRMPMLDALEETDTSIESELLDATGKTQVLSEDYAVETGTAIDADIGDDEATLLAPDYGDDDADEDTEVAGDVETLLAPMDDDEEDFDFAKTEALPPEAFTGDASIDETGEMPAVAETDVDLDLDDLTAALKVSEIGDTVEQPRDDATVEQPRPSIPEETSAAETMSISPDEMSDDLHEARTMTEVGTKLDLARAYVDMGDPAGARSILEEVLDEGDEGQIQQAQQLLDSLPS